MPKYKAVVSSVFVAKTDKDSKTYPSGTPYINVCWVCTHYENSETYGQYMPIDASNEKKLYKRYYVSTVPIGKDNKPTIIFTKEQMQNHFNYDGDSSQLQTIVGYENELITDIDAEGRESVKYVNNPKRASGMGFSKEVDKDEFANIFDLPF